MYFAKGLRACVKMQALVVGLLVSFSIKADIKWLPSTQNDDGRIAQATNMQASYQLTTEVLQTMHTVAPALITFNNLTKTFDNLNGNYIRVMNVVI